MAGWEGVQYSLLAISDADLMFLEVVVVGRKHSQIILFVPSAMSFRSGTNVVNITCTRRY